MKNNKYIDILLDYAKEHNKSPAMAYMDLVLKNKNKCLQYSKAVEIIYKEKLYATTDIR